MHTHPPQKKPWSWESSKPSFVLRQRLGRKAQTWALCVPPAAPLGRAGAKPPPGPRSTKSTESLMLSSPTGLGRERDCGVPGSLGGGGGAMSLRPSPGARRRQLSAPPGWRQAGSPSAHGDPSSSSAPTSRTKTIGEVFWIHGSRHSAETSPFNENVHLKLFKKLFQNSFSGVQLLNPLPFAFIYPEVGNENLGLPEAFSVPFPSPAQTCCRLSPVYQILLLSTKERIRTHFWARLLTGENFRYFFKL